MTLALIVWLGLSALAVSARAATVDGTAQTLTVGVKISPPFVESDGDRYSGLAVDLWKRAAAAHGWHYRFNRYDLEGLLDAVADHRVDVGLGAITATARRQQHMDSVMS